MEVKDDKKVIGKSAKRWDAIAKVTGKAEYTDDLPIKNPLYGKIVRSKIAHGRVTSLDITLAEKVDGVVAILTPDNVSQLKYPTAGHPYALADPTADISDRKILTADIKQYGDEIAAVVATNELAAIKASKLIKATYEEYPVYLTTSDAMSTTAMKIHPEFDNVFAKSVNEIGDINEGFKNADRIIECEYETQMVQHCHMENQVAYAYKDADNRYVCVSSTQIPHIARRILGQAFGMPWGQFRVIKPFIGGGFGNKQDVTIEPLVVAMSMACSGKPVKLILTREESMAYTRVRHPISYKMKVGFKNNGLITAWETEAISDNGAYASHGHSICAKGGTYLYSMFNIDNMLYDAKTVFTNKAVGGAMRGYGLPQITFAIESLMDKAAKELNIDVIDIRMKNLRTKANNNPFMHVDFDETHLDKCIEKGVKEFNWHEKRKEADLLNSKNTDYKYGLGLATFNYGTGVYPKSLEIAGARLVLNQDGSVKLQVSATEIGQGSDTAFSQMAAETLGISFNKVIRDKNTDTDTDPFDTGAYASRQSYVTGMAVKEASIQLKNKILLAYEKFHGVSHEDIDLVDDNIVSSTGEILESLGDLALKTYYDIEKGECLTAEVSNNCHSNSLATGVTFSYVKVDIITGKVTILSLLNVHDSGTIINPLLATGQVEGGMMMGIGFGLMEELKYDDKGVPLNNNLLDYKFPTFMDLCDLQTSFVEVADAYGPYGNKSLGEPPTCSPAAALRNAVCNAINIDINSLPLSPQKVFEALRRD